MTISPIQCRWTGTTEAPRVLCDRLPPWGDASQCHSSGLIGDSGSNDFHRPVPRGTIVAMTSAPLRTIRDRFSEFVERVQGHHERVVVTRNGTPAAVLINPDDLESLEETIAVLSDSEAVAELIEAHRAYVEGDVVRGADAVRALRPR